MMGIAEGLRVVFVCRHEGAYFIETNDGAWYRSNGERWDPATELPPQALCTHEFGVPEWARQLRVPISLCSLCGRNISTEEVR